MARLPSSGSSLSTLYEFEIGLDQVIVELGLKPLWSEDEKKIRFGLGTAIGRWVQEHKAFDTLETPLMADELRPREKGKKKVTRLRVRDLKATLEAMASGVESVVRVLRSREGGFINDLDLLAANKVWEFLGKNPEAGGEDKVDSFLRDFCNKGDAISHACRTAAWDMAGVPPIGSIDRGSREPKKGKAGAPRLNWYGDFIRIVAFVADRNGIPVEGRGRFVDVAWGFERLLYPEMRSRNRKAVATRVSRALWPQI
jgi:hypothetical protein